MLLFLVLTWKKNKIKKMLTHQPKVTGKATTSNSMTNLQIPKTIGDSYKVAIGTTTPKRVIMHLDRVPIKKYRNKLGILEVKKCSTK